MKQQDGQDEEEMLIDVEVAVLDFEILNPSFILSILLPILSIP